VFAVSGHDVSVAATPSRASGAEDFASGFRDPIGKDPRRLSRFLAGDVIACLWPAQSPAR
jgi:hypothetical protein